MNPTTRDKLSRFYERSALLDGNAQEAALSSIAISLKRIADAIGKPAKVKLTEAEIALANDLSRPDFSRKG